MKLFTGVLSIPVKRSAFLHCITKYFDYIPEIYEKMIIT